MKTNRRRHRAKKRRLVQRKADDAEAEKLGKQIPKLRSMRAVRRYLSQKGSLTPDQLAAVYRSVGEIAAYSPNTSDAIAAFRALLDDVKQRFDAEQRHNSNP